MMKKQRQPCRRDKQTISPWHDVFCHGKALYLTSSRS
jgi:hypothetical protein